MSRVAITGIGCYSSIGKDIEEFEKIFSIKIQILFIILMK